MSAYQRYYTFQEVRQQILDRFDGIEDDTVLKRNVDNSIQRNLDDLRYEAQRDFTAYIVKNYRQNMTSGQREYSIPPKMVDIVEVRYYDADDDTGQYTVLTQIPYNELFTRYKKTDSGVPTYFSTLGDDLVLAATPNSSSDYIEIDYASTGDELVDDNDIVAIPSKYLSTLVKLVEAETMIYEGDKDTGIIYTDRAKNGLDRVMQIGTQRSGGLSNTMTIGFQLEGKRRRR